MNSGFTVPRTLHGKLVRLLISCDVAVPSYPVNENRVVFAHFRQLAFDRDNEFLICLCFIFQHEHTFSVLAVGQHVNLCFRRKSPSLGSRLHDEVHSQADRIEFPNVV